ncbi:Structural maintenance of chromosomes protein 5 [Tilletia horrida]|nr:Structural maintenance of chromosomes protein 5 [Tilletia horrida]
MPDISRARAATQPNDHSRDLHDDGDAAPGGSLPNGVGSSRKRGRHELSDLEDEEDDEDDDAAGEAARAAKRKKQRDLVIERTMQDRDVDGYLPGSIVRVKLLRFVTYDAVEFRPGPYLNMIIGPNGTGKSTIVCAIALGLGWRPHVLGRAKDVAAFVKQGYDTGSIEVELKGKPGQRNLKIRREISRKDNQSDWYIDGQKTTQKEVHARVNALDIKIDNLCSFLPQDKVADFARMAPPQLLKEVQKAAGEGDLIEQHEKLTELGREEVKVADKLASAQAEVDHLKQRQEVLERDVQRFKERQAIERQVKFLEIRVPQLKYTKARERSLRFKPQVQRRKARVERAKLHLKPYEQVKEDYEEFSEKLRLRKDKAKTSLDKVAKDLQKCVSVLEKKEHEAEGLHQKMASLDQREANHRQRVETLKAEIRELQAAIANPPDIANTQGIEQEVRKIRMKERALISERSDLKASMEEINLENRSLRLTLDDSRKKLASLDNVRQQRLTALQSADKDAFRAVLWLRDNQQLFSGKIYEPVLLEASIKDMRFAAAAESCLNWATFRTFVCETRSDYDIFTRELVDRQKLRLNVVEVENFDDNLLKGVYPPEVLRNYNFDTTAIDVVDAPAPVLKYLSHSSNLHRIPLSLMANPAPDLLETIANDGQIHRFVYGGINYSVTISSYGNRRSTTTTKPFAAKPRNFGTAVDQNRKRELEQAVLDCNTRAQESEGRLQQLMQREQVLKADLAKLDQQRLALTEETRAAQAARTQYEKDKNKLSTKKTHLQEAVRRPSTETERSNIRQVLRRLAADRANLAQDIKSHMIQQNKLRMEYDIHFLEILQHESNRTAFAEQFKKAQDKVESEKAALNDVMEREKASRRQAKALLERYQTLFNAAEPEITTMLNETPVQEDVIQKHSDNIASLTEEKQELDSVIKEIRDSWEPAIRSLVEEVSNKFSAAFDRIGCAGEIRVATERDYDKWGIEILVKFRDNEELQLLTGQRQSGGERSLSTIMFLMGLTELGKSPFSLVDEINQGMDQRAERAVHNQMVDVTCGQHARQYFLITPKLLNHLKYHERMRVLIICNGEWLPPKFNFKSVLKHHRDREEAKARMQAA